MPHWKQPYLSTDKGGWTTVTHTLSQHQNLLEMSGFPCKVLIKQTIGDEIGNAVTPIDIPTWDVTTPAPKKVIWTDGDDESIFPDTRSFIVWLDGEELTQVYSAANISSDTEFYVKSEINILGVNDNISLYLNTGLDVAGAVVSYMCTSIAKNINILEHSQPSDYANTYRTEYYEGFTQYTNPAAKFRDVSVPHTIPISFPATPFDTVYMGQGKFETHVNTCWTMSGEVGFPALKEFDVIYRPDLDNWYVIKNYSPNYIPYNGEMILATQNFEVAQISPYDSIKDFDLK